MKKVWIVIFYIFLFWQGCSNSEPKQEFSETKPNTFEDVAPEETLMDNELTAEEEITTDSPEAPFVASQTSEKLIVGEIVGQYNLPNTNQSVSYYFPTDQNLSGVIVLFDAQGRGLLPVRRYASIAKKYGFALIGSNYSSNTVKYPDIQQHHQAILAQVNEWGIENEYVFLSGFSGGARAATQLSFDFNHKAVIACGAGLFNNDETPLNNCFFYGLVGNADFNYQEMMQLKEKFKSSFYVCIDVFKGGHQWPSAIQFEPSLKWLMLQEMKMDLIPKDENLYNKWYIDYIEELNNTEFEQVIFELSAIERGFYYFNQLMPTLAFDDMKETLIASNKYGRFALKRPIGSYVMSVWRNKAYEGVSQQKTYDWWEQQWQELQAEKEKNKVPIIKNAFLQAEGYLSLLLYLGINSSLKNNNLEIAKEQIKAFKLVDANNVDQYFLDGLLALQAGDNEKMISEFSQMTNYGFDKKSMFISHELIIPHKGKDWYADVVNRIDENIQKVR